MKIKNFDKLIRGEYAGEREIVLKVIENVLQRMDGYNLVKESVKMVDDTILINGRKIDINFYRNVYLIGFGKASSRMALAMEEYIYFDDGAIISSIPENLRSVKLYIGSHPVASAENVEASRHIINILKKAGKEDIVFVLISGGGSAMLCVPRIPLNEFNDVVLNLMKKGCTIEELNVVRKHLSYVKGGQLAQMTNARIVSLIISDIIGNPVDAIASGPTAGDQSTFEDAYRILKKYKIMNREAINVIKKGMKGEIPETPVKTNAENFIIGDINKACRIAENEARKEGYTPINLKCDLTGEAREIGKSLAEYAKYHPRNHIIVISGGETTVKVKGNGIGGRNQEIVLAALKEIDGMPVVFASIGTDGIDGSSPAAGAIADGRSMERAMAMQIKPEDFLSRNDSYSFFEKLQDAIITGYTGTNVMDLQIILKK